MAFGILALVCAIAGSVVILGKPVFGFLLIIFALFFAWAAEEGRKKRGRKP